MIAMNTSFKTYIMIHTIPFYKNCSYKKQLIELGIIRNRNPLNFSTIRNNTIKKPTFFQKLRNNDVFLQFLKFSLH